jgi:hypothetical protein
VRRWALGGFMLIPKIEQRIRQYLDFLEKNAYKKIADLEFEVFEASKIR